MTMELHIWGPAFSLPSIDPQCLATIAYLKQTVPKNEWVLVASSDPSSSPTKEYPSLVDGTTTIGGFQNIIDYLHQKSNGQWNLNTQFNKPKARADITAFSSHIVQSVQPLLDLSLYVSSENYSSTRSAYTPILAWPTQYYIPLSRRSLAKARTGYLGLSGLDVDTVDDEEDKRRKLDDMIPSGLRTSKKTLAGLLKEKGGGNRFKIDSLVDVAYEPLQKLLGQKKYMLLDEKPSSLDCLALGYLSLALLPDLPQRWLAEGMKARYPELCAYVKGGVQECFGGPVKPEDAGLKLGAQASRPETALPWRAPRDRGAMATGATMLHATLDSIPFYQSNIINMPPNEEALATTPSSSLLFPAIMTATTAVAAVSSYFLYTGLSAEPEKQRLSDMGEAGAIFAGLDFGSAKAKRTDKVLQGQGQRPFGLEVGVEANR
ncbi:sorting and assembly machinery component 37, partial [Lecanoromycetidae sp. Uapishka_2]